MKYKTFFEASCKHNMHTGEKVFCNCYFGSRLFSERLKKLVVYLICMTLVWISREDKIKRILITKTRLVLLYVDSKFDVPKCKYAWKNSSLKC